MLAFVLIPLISKAPGVQRAAVATARVASYTGTATILFGLVLIARTRGYGSLFGSEWGGIILSCIVIAMALMGIGDGALRPAVSQIPENGDIGRARRLALTGFVLSVVAVGLMTRAIYAPT